MQSNLETKKMYFGNFNITFGENNEPMLAHFCDIIYPAFTSGLSRGKKEKGEPVYSFSDVEIAKTKNERLVMSGMYIKDTHLGRRTTKQDNGDIINSPAQFQSSPISRFIIFLDNHKMVLIKNEASSPDIRSFQRTVTDVIKNYRKAENEKRKKSNQQKIPYAIIDIVDISLEEDVQKAISELAKIKRFRINFFPLNGDMDEEVGSAFNTIRHEMNSIDTKSAKLIFNSPKGKNEVAKLASSVSKNGIARFLVDGRDSKGAPRKIKEDSFTQSKDVLCRGDINDISDSIFEDAAEENPIIQRVSDSNKKIFEAFKDKLLKLLL